ncbi:rhodanese-like domain-containing protein [Granulicella sp. dw_53]|uniref:rhodanese-like domain-containing protein n=1 Tax=Granulicella sp. dw_53 TaxID=2719792 RepID=UPI001BD2F75E|nr:rhodanese-like domain-containing protein [Granulicella sp. dw_53]
MTEIVICAVALGLLGLVIFLVRSKRVRERRELEEHSIAPEALHDLLEAKEDVIVLDVRQPLDLLAHSEIIPGARRIAPKEVMEEVRSIPRDQETVVYCTCPAQKTSREVLQKALAMGFTRIRFLEGGLAAWKAKGFPVKRYDEAFHLDTAS